MKKMILSLFAIMALVPALTSCSAEYQAKQKQKQFNDDAAKCESYGAKRGSSEFISCMATIEAGRQTVIVRQPDLVPASAYLYR